jgi:hypothetical protein
VFPAFEDHGQGVSGIRHSVDAEAESVYEAAIRGVAILKKDGWTTPLGIPTKSPFTMIFNLIAAGPEQNRFDQLSVISSVAFRQN